MLAAQQAMVAQQQLAQQQARELAERRGAGGSSLPS
jgi:hypothetical protein